MKENDEKRKWSQIVILKGLLRCITLIFMLFTIGTLQLFADSIKLERFTISKKNTYLRELFDEIERDSEFLFFYDNSEIDVSRKVSLSVNNSSIKEILDILFKDSDIVYETKDRYIVLSKKDTKNTKNRFVAQQQKNDISGKVVDLNGEPLPGVTIMVKGTNKGTISDLDGAFYLTDIRGDEVLQFSFVGMKSQEVLIKGRETLNIEMQDESMGLEEVVVLGFGQTQRKIAQTGSVAQISNKEIIQSPVSNVTNALAGRLPGLITIQKSGEPGRDASDLYIRGRGTLNTSAPLITIDGVQKNSDALNILDPNEIENITILKDASATALYGVKGANGVVIITTRRGKEGKPTINLRTQMAMQNPTRVPKFLGSYDYARLYNEAYFNEHPYETQNNAPYDSKALEAYRTGSDPYRYPDVDWADEILQNSLSSQTNFSITGGSKQVKYFVNIGYQYQGGLYKTEKNKWNSNYNPNFERSLYNFRSNVDIDFDESFSLGLTLYGAIEDRNYPNVSAYNMFGQFISRIPPNAMVIKYPTGYYGRHNSSYNNPIARINASGFSEEFNSSLSGMLNVTKKLDSVLKGFSLKANVSFDGYFKNTHQRRMEVPYALFTGGEVDDLNDPENYSYNRAYQPLAKPTNSTWQNRDVWLDISANYSRSYGSHKVSALLLGNRQHRVLGADIPYVSQGLVGRLTYDYDSRYFAEFNAGYNGTDNFHKDRRYGFFPAVSIGWVPIVDRDIFRFLKLRTSYGLTGNDQIGGRRWLFIEEFTSGLNYNFGSNLTSNKGIIEGALANQKVTWEKAKRLNIGVETKLFHNDLLNVNLDVFYENRKDMLIFPGSIPYMVGVPTGDLPPLNQGRTENKGLEFELGHRYSIGDFFYFLNGNIGYAKNKLIEIDEEDHRYKNLLRTGHSIGQQFGLVAIGFFENEADIINSRPQGFGKVIPGDVKYLDVNKDGVIDNNDITAIGKSDVPEITFGVNMGGNWRNFDLSVLLQGAAGFSVMRERETAWEFFNGGKVMDMHLNRWTPETAQTAIYPVLHTGFNENNHRPSTLFQRKGDYLRLKNIEVGYTFRSLYLSENYTVSSIRFYLSGMNLHTWDSSEGDFDPETSGGRYWSYPQVRVFNIGFSLNI